MYENNEIKFPKRSIILILIFVLFSFGFYVPIWFLRRKKIFNELKSNEKISVAMPILVIVLILLNIIFIFVVAVFEELGSIGDNIRYIINIIDTTSSLFVCIISLFLCFKARKILDDHYIVYLKKNVKFSKLAIFCFGVFYLQYKINRLDRL